MNKFLTLMANLREEPFILEPNVANNIYKDLEALRNDYIAGNTELTPMAGEDEVTYSVNGNVAVIAIDGTMYKKNISSMCWSIVSYDQMIKAIDKAEADDNIDTILFRVDTNGGSVAGAEEVRERIEKSTKKTVLYAENSLCSGGMWIFTAVDEIYSNKVTNWGSIGVVIFYQDEDDNVKYITSRDAENKVCDIKDESCKNRIFAKLNKYEDIFYENLLKAYPNKTREQIKSDFDSGATVLADVALKNGYIKEIIDFNTLYKRLVSNNSKINEPLVSIPSIPSIEEKMVNSTKEQGELMTIETENPTATVEATNPTEQVDVEETSFDYEAYQKEVMALAGQYNATNDTILEMLSAKDLLKAENIALKAQNKALFIQEPTSAGVTVEASVQDVEEKEEPLFTKDELQKMREEF